VIDAWGKPTPGILNGQILWVGDYDECLNTRSKHESSDLTFQGRYCRATQMAGMGMAGPSKFFFIYKLLFFLVLNHGAQKELPAVTTSHILTSIRCRN